MKVKKDTTYKIRLSAEDRKELEEAAKSLDIKLAEYLRESGLNRAKRIKK